MCIQKHLLSLVSSLFVLATGVSQSAEEGFKVLFDGKSLDGWKVVYSTVTRGADDDRK